MFSMLNNYLKKLNKFKENHLLIHEKKMYYSVHSNDYILTPPSKMLILSSKKTNSLSKSLTSYFYWLLVTSSTATRSPPAIKSPSCISMMPEMLSILSPHLFFFLFFSLTHSQSI